MDKQPGIEKKLRATAFFGGLGLGLLVSGAALAPSDTRQGDKYFWWAVIGVAAVVVCTALAYHYERKALKAARAENLTELLKGVKKNG